MVSSCGYNIVILVLPTKFKLVILRLSFYLKTRFMMSPDESITLNALEVEGSWPK